MRPTTLALLATLLLSTTHTLAEETPCGEYRYPIEEGTKSGWAPDPYLPPLAAPILTEKPDGKSPSLILRPQFPNPAGILRETSPNPQIWGKGKTIRITLWVPHQAGAYPSAALTAHHPVWGWFNTTPTRLLKPGEWNTIYWPLGENAPDWTSTDGKIAWNNTLRHQLDRIGLRIYPDPNLHPQENAEDDDTPEYSTPDLRLAEFTILGTETPPPPLEIQSIKTAPAKILEGKRAEITFQLTRAYDNPYDPETIAVDATFTGPGAQTIHIPAFYYQDYNRSKLTDQTERLEPIGMATWKIRFHPPAAGPWKARITARDKTGATCETTTLTLNATSAHFPGYLQVDPRDHNYLSFTKGDFYYPIGLIVRSPTDQRKLYELSFTENQKEDSGTYAYDKYFQSMAAAGINFTRVWMSAWWTAIEWTHGYRTDYEGIGRYNQLNAWRMDYVMDLAEKLGIYVDITLHNHGQFRANLFDEEWYDNPYYRGQGGPAELPEEFWTNPEAKKYMKKRLRYLAARWGSSPAIAWWELCNEVDLITRYNSANIRAWHQEMSQYIHSIDPGNHLVTTHYTANRFDPNVMGLPEMQIGQSTAYNADMPARLLQLYTEHHALQKPAYNNEFGVGNSHIELEYNLHAGLWTSTVLPYCGASLFWWWPYVQSNKQYYHYEAINRFRANEDLRGKNYQPIRPAIAPQDPAAPANARGIETIGMQNETSARLWIFDPRIYRAGRAHNTVRPIVRQIPAARFTLDGLKPGKYNITYWDTWKGEPIKKDNITLEIRDNTLEIPTPPFERDIACRVDHLP